MNRTKGIFLTIIAASSFGLIPLFAKTAYDNGFNPYTFSLFRSAFATVAIYILLKLRNIDYRVEKQQYSTLFYASFIGYSLTMVTLVMSYNYMATGLATTLHFVYPAAVVAGAVIIFKERIQWQKGLALFVSLIGIYFLAGFAGSNRSDIIGIILALVSGLFYAYYILVIAYGNIKNLNPFVLAFYISLLNTYILLIGALLTGNFDMNYTYKGIASTVLVALACNLVGMAAFQAGVKEISASAAAILSTFEPITSLVVGVTILGEHLSWYHITGSLLIIVSIIAVTLPEKKNSNTGNC